MAGHLKLRNGYLKAWNSIWSFILVKIKKKVHDCWTFVFEDNGYLKLRNSYLKSRNLFVIKGRLFEIEQRLCEIEV